MVMGQHFLFFGQVLAHLGFLYLICYGALWQWLITCLMYFLTGCLGMSVTYHRLFSHKSFSAPRWFQHLGLIFGGLGLTGTALAWVAVHREHHGQPDGEKDPHSPHKMAWWRVQFFSMYYRPKLKLTKDLFKNKLVIFYHRRYLWLQLAYVVPLLLLVGWESVIYAYLAPAALLWHGGSLINTLGHTPLFGYRNYSTRDKSINNPLLGILMWGEGWHNNHHARPRDYFFGRKKWEIDVSSWVIRLVRVR